MRKMRPLESFGSAGRAGVVIDVAGSVAALSAAADFFFLEELPKYDPAELIPPKGGDEAMAKKVLTHALEILPAVEFTHDPLNEALRAAATQLGLKAGQAFQPIRVAVCGRKNAPPLFETMAVLGKEVCLKRIQQAISYLSSVE